MAKQIIDLRPFFTLTEERSEILLRTADVNTIRQHREYKTYNPRYSHLNFEIDEDGVLGDVNKKSLVSRVDEHLRSQGLTNPNSEDSKSRRKIGAVIMFSGSKERMQQMAFGVDRLDFSPDGSCPDKIDTTNYEIWCIQLRDFLCRRYGKKNLVAIIAHLDIARPEVIAIVLAVGDGKYFSYNEVFAGQDGFEYRRRDIDLWNSLYEQVNVKWDLERGERHSVASGHFYTATTAEVEMLQKMRNSLNEEIKNKTEELNKLNEEFAMADRRVKGLSTMLANLENKKAEIEAEISSLESQAREDNSSLDDIRQRKEELFNALPGVLEKLSQRQKQVAVARRELQEILSWRREVEEVIAMLKKSNRFRPSSSDGKTIFAMRNTIWKELMNYGKELHSAVLSAADDFNNIVRTTRYRDPIETSDIEILLNNGSLLVEIATAIYIGDLANANELAEKNGLRITLLERGKYFDNTEFMEKCFSEALNMIKEKNREE